MVQREQLYQTITLFVMVLFFDLMERRRARNTVDRKRELTLNIFALLVVIVAGEMWKLLLQTGVRALNPGSGAFLGNLRRLPGMAKLLLGIVLADFCLYWVHWAMHKRRLWPTHTFHHSIAELWWLSGSRTSVTHLLLFAVPQVLVAYYVLDFSPAEAGVAFSFGVAVNVWIHTNLWVNIGPLEQLLVTPNFHRVHHGARGLSNNNLGFVFTIWDRMFGTYVNPRSTGKDFALGHIATKGRLLRMIVGL